MTASLDHALESHRAGKLDRAELLYQAILARQPDHADALHLLGMLMHQRGRSGEAIRLIRRAIEVHPNQAVYHSNLGLVLGADGQIDAAIAAHREAVRLDPASIAALNNLAVALATAGQTAEAIDCLKRAVLLQPEFDAGDAHKNLLHLMGAPPGSAQAFHTLGDLFQENGKPTLAVECYRQAARLEPESAETLNNLGNALAATGDRGAALSCYEQALALRPDFPQACNNLANVLRDLERYEEAVAAYKRAVALQPTSPDPLGNLGNLLRDAGQWDLAMQCYQQALAVSPDHVPTHNNIGNAHCERGNWQAAIESYSCALSIHPDYADAINNLGTALEEIGERDPAMQCYQRALALEPTSISAPWNIALQQLLRGDYKNGWPGYEHRWRQKKQSRSKRDFPQPMPTSLEELKGRRVLLHAEQGFGDAIQFCRYVPMVLELGAEVIVECPAPLVRLFMQSFAAQAGRPGLLQVVVPGDPLPAFDLHCPLMSLPGLFGTTLENVPSLSYLAPDADEIEKWKHRFLAFFPSRVLRYSEEPHRPRKKSGSSEYFRDRRLRDDSLRVGLVWAGQSTHQKDRARSLSFDDFAPLLVIDGVQFFSLQVGPAASQCKPPVTDWTADLKDFADTAALISQLDLVITVDTAVCHLAGAMGKPVWILLAYQPDWRWLLDREDSPWYPSARLFRQTKPGDWTEPLRRINQCLLDHR